MCGIVLQEGLQEAHTHLKALEKELRVWKVFWGWVRKHSDRGAAHRRRANMFIGDMAAMFIIHCILTCVYMYNMHIGDIAVMVIFHMITYISICIYIYICVCYPYIHI